MKKQIAYLLTLALLFSHATTAFAEGIATPSSTATNSAATTQKLRERIEKVVEEKREQIAGVLDEITGQRRGYIGEVQRITSETMTLRSLKGTRIVSLRPSVRLIKANQTITVEQIAVGDWAIVIGSMQDDELQPERILISSTNLRPKAQVVTIGSLSHINSTSVSVLSRGTNEEITFTLPKSVVLQDINGAPIKINQITPEMQAVVVGQRPTDSTLEALLIRVLVANPLPTTPKPTPRSSPKPAASPSNR